MAIVLDAMGSDDYPGPEIQAAVDGSILLDEEIILVGKEALLKDRLATALRPGARVRIVDAPDVLEMDEKPVEAAKRKPRNSMAVGLGLIKSGEASAFVSAGNTGGVMFNALRTLGRIQGVQRPGLTTLFPVSGGRCVVVDIGANADCRPDFLLQFGIMGSVYAQKVLGKANPRVGLISNGEEAGKGNQLIKDTYPLLEQSGLNFIGNVEGKELFGGGADVAVCDGFTGNVLLKSSEAVARLLTDTLKSELKSSPVTMLGAVLAKPAFGKLRALMDPGEVGAAPLLGIDGLVFVAHGRSDARALTNGLKVAKQAIQANLIEAMRVEVGRRLAQAENPKTPA